MLTRVVAVLALGLALAAGCLAGATLLAAEGPSGEPGHAPQAAGHTETPKAKSEGGHGEGGGVNPLDFKGDLAIWTAVVFLVLLLILWKFAWGPIAEGLDKREKQIAHDISSAEQANQEARKILSDYQQKLAAAGEEVRRMLEAARREAEQAGREMMEKTKAEIEIEHQRALREIENATAGALKELADRSATLAVELAGRIVGAKLDAAGHTRLIEQAVADFVKQEPSRN